MKTMTFQNQQIQLGYGNINHLIPHELWHCELSLPALGLASYLYTLPKCWKLSVTHLSKQLLMSKNTCRKYLKEIFSNQKARELFQVVDREVATYDFEEGFTAYDYDDRQEELEKFTSSVAKDVSEENKKRVMIIQTKEQRYLFNFIVGLKPKELTREVESKRDNPQGVKSSEIATRASALAMTENEFYNAQKPSSSKNEPESTSHICSKFDHYIKESKDSFKDSSNKTRAQKTTNVKAKNSLTCFPVAQNLTASKICDEKAGLRSCERGDKAGMPIAQASDKLPALSRKAEALNEGSKRSDKKLADFLDLQDFTEQEQELIRFWITYKQERAKAKLTPSQIDFQLRKITRLKNEGQDIVAVIERSLENSWSGLFPLRDSVFGAEAAMPSSPARDRRLALSCALDSTNTTSASKSLESQRQNSNKIKNGKSILGRW